MKMRLTKPSCTGNESGRRGEPPWAYKPRVDVTRNPTQGYHAIGPKERPLSSEEFYGILH